MPTRGRRECASACDTQACLAGLLYNCASAYLYSHRAALVRRTLCTLACIRHTPACFRLCERKGSLMEYVPCLFRDDRKAGLGLSAPTAAISGPRFLLSA